MGLFDFFNKNKLAQVFLGEKKDVSEKPVQHDSKLLSFKKEKRGEQAFVGNVVEQDGIIPLGVLLKKATLSKQGLYPHEILMLDYAPHFKRSKNSFQSFWYWQYSVTKPQAVLDSLFERGFIKVGNLRSALARLTIPEIKQELKQFNQKVTGNKSVLIDRLIEFGELTVLNKKYSERYYELTSKGEQELKDNQYVSYLHRNKYMTIWKMNEKIAKTHYPYRDILWGYFNERSLVHFKKSDFGLYTNVRLNMYRFLMEERKHSMAFQMLCEVISFDLSGLQNNDNILCDMKKSNTELYGLISEHFFPYEESILKIPPAVSSWFAEMQIILGLDDSDYREATLKELQKVRLPRRIFTNEESVDILMSEIHNDKDTLRSIYKKAEQRENARQKD